MTTIIFLLLVFVATCHGQEECVPAEAPLSIIQHSYATNNLEVSRVSFSSCHVPEDMYQVVLRMNELRELHVLKGS